MNRIKQILSTIVEIIKSLQTLVTFVLFVVYLRQQKLSSPYRQRHTTYRIPLSTIVEIIKSLQTKIIVYVILSNLRQQKLSSPYRLFEGLNEVIIIYDSRNYQVLIDGNLPKLSSLISTIVEIIKSLQTTQNTTLRRIIYDSRNYQVLIDLYYSSHRDTRIYDSRNYQVLIDSTYTPCLRLDLRQQKLSSPYRLCYFNMVRLHIYDSRNYQVLIDSYFLQNYIKSFI